MERDKGKLETDGAAPEESLDALLGIYLGENPENRHGGYWSLELRETKTGPKMRALDLQAQADLVSELVHR